MTPQELSTWITERSAAILQIPTHYVEPDQTFASLGMDSIGMLELTGDLAAKLNQELSPSLIWEHPTINALASHLSSTDDIGEPPIRPVSREGPLPQTFAQERMWRTIVANGLDARQQVSKLLVLQGGDLDLPLLTACFHALGKRHEALRTHFVEVAGAASQVILPSPLAELKVTDLTGHPNAESEAWQLDKENRTPPIPHDVGPLARFSLYILGPGNYRLSLQLHHIICDGESNQILLEDLSHMYQNGLRGADLAEDLPDLAVQTADYAAWQREWLQPKGPAWQKHMDWWNEYLGPHPAPISCQKLQWSKAPVEADPSLTPIHLHLPAAETKSLHALAAREGTSFANIAYTATAIALHRHGTPAGALMGSYVTDRRRPSLMRLPGLFVNLAVMRIPDTTNRTFLELLAEVSQIRAQITVHQDLAFEELASFRQEAKLPAPHPQMIVNFRNTPEVPPTLAPGISISPWTSGTLTRHIPWGLTHRIIEQEGMLQVAANFDTGRYDPEKVRGQLQTIVTILEEAAHGHNGTY